jgi:hypothetical protein
VRETLGGRTSPDGQVASLVFTSGGGSATQMSCDERRDIERCSPERSVIHAVIRRWLEAHRTLQALGYE